MINNNFRTEIQILRSNTLINHQDKLLMIGSCFAENIGKKLIENKFQLLLNPFGVLYNPAS
ncbi:MAG TPA: GSCFA domain-containing protein, partial [Bacteroidales bacterium]|nr:GSCFA domain-containing protein [Bacteroidales bacterium]